MAETLQLKQGDTVLGTLHEVQWDMFWSDARFEPADAFTPYKALFEEEYEALESEDWEKCDPLEERISDLGLCLVSDDGEKTITEFMIHIHDNQARFRY